MRAFGFYPRYSQRLRKLLSLLFRENQCRPQAQVRRRQLPAYRSNQRSSSPRSPFNSHFSSTVVQCEITKTSRLLRHPAVSNNTVTSHPILSTFNHTSKTSRRHPIPRPTIRSRACPLLQSRSNDQLTTYRRQTQTHTSRLRLQPPTAISVSYHNSMPTIHTKHSPISQRHHPSSTNKTHNACPRLPLFLQTRR